MDPALPSSPTFPRAPRAPSASEVPAAVGPVGSVDREASPPWFVVGRDRLCFLRDGAQAFPAMLEAIRNARQEILLEMYWIGSDALGTRFRDALAERARNGVTVKVVYDALGSAALTPPFWEPLRAAGGQVRAFHALFGRVGGLGLVAWERLERRDHRKLLIVDSEHGFTGGINLSAPWLAVDQGGKGFRDDQVAVRGPAAGEMRTQFYRTWRRLGGPMATPLGAPRRLGLGRPRRPVWILAGRWARRRSIHREYVVRIQRARRTVDIANSYFIPDKSVLRALRAARRRGVRVRLLVPARSDVPFIQYAVEATFEALLHDGVEIYSLPGPMLHAKTAIIDGVFTTVGSYNLDHRSYRKNLELNVAVLDEAFARAVTRSFDEDVAAARAIDLAAWRRRPVSQRAAEWVARSLRKLW